VELGEEEATKMVEQYVKDANTAGHFKKEDAKHPRYEQKQSYQGGYRSNSGNTNSRYHSGNSNSRYGGGAAGGGGGGGSSGDYRNQRYGGQQQGGGGFVRRDNREG